MSAVEYQGFFERATQFDTAQVLIWAFVLFVGGLFVWLRREDKREGYPLVSETPVGHTIQGFPSMPGPKLYRKLWTDEITQTPHHYASSRMLGRRLLRFPGAPLVPVGNPLLAELGPGAYPLRGDEPLLSYGEPQVVPLRVAPDWRVAKGDNDPRGLPVFDQGRSAAGTVTELWVDKGTKMLRYLEVTLHPAMAAAEGQRVLVPIYYTSTSRSRVVVRSLLDYQFADIPGIASPDQITAREEDRVNAYHAAGLMFSRGTDGGLPSRGVPEGAVPSRGLGHGLGGLT